MFAALPVGKVRTASTYRKEILMSNSTILQVSARLDSDKQWSTLFDILHDYGEELTAVWLKGEKELSLSFAEMTRRADDYAAWLTENTPEGGWIAISVDTCPNWPTLFWGVIRSVPKDLGRGFIWWEPAWLPVPGAEWAKPASLAYVHEPGPGGNEWANQGLFDYDGNALPALHLIADL